MGRFVYLLVPIFAWIIAQSLKILFAKNRKKTSLISKIYISGGMPSSHSASIVALTTIVGIKNGYDSALFGIAAIISAIVIYDAVNVRRAVGEQGAVLKGLLKTQQIHADPYQASGHTLGEVIGGIVVGVAIAYISYIFLK